MTTNPNQYTTGSAGTHLQSDYSTRCACSPKSVSWGAIFAGLTTALALQVLLLMLGTGLGFALYSPVTAEDPVGNLSMGAVIVHSVCAILSLCAGGWVAGRFTPRSFRAAGWLHGFCVWCAATVAGVVMVALGAGWMLSGIANVVGGGLSAVGQPVAAVAGEATDAAGAALERSSSSIESFTKEALSNRSEDADDGSSIRAEREVGMALSRLFNPAEEANIQVNRATAVEALVEYTDMNQADAERAVEDWTQSFEQLKTDLARVADQAAMEAKEAADTAADVLATFSLIAFFAFLIGAAAASGGGALGAICAGKCDEDEDLDDDSGYGETGAMTARSTERDI